MTETWQERCARKLTATLSRRGRKPQTRKYMATFPRRPKIIVAPEDFGTNIIRSAPAAPSVEPVRKDRLRPRYSRWACRPSGFRSTGKPRIAPRPIRDKGECERQRSLLGPAQEYFCALCGAPLNGERSLEHVVPFAAGGCDRIGNLLLTHGDCNARKSDDIPTGCEIVWLLTVNAVLGVEPQKY